MVKKLKEKNIKNSNEKKKLCRMANKTSEKSNTLIPK